jgi:ferritin
MELEGERRSVDYCAVNRLFQPTETNLRKTQNTHMSPSVISALSKQGTQELATSKSYLAMAYWCEMENWSGFASLFRLQADEEQAHGRKFFDFLVNRDAGPVIGSVPAPRADFPDLTAVAKAAYDMERANTAAIHAVYELALTEKDYATQVFLHEFILEQVEEEAWTDKLLAKTRQATCAGGLFNLDRHVVKEVLGEK